MSEPCIPDGRGRAVDRRGLTAGVVFVVIGVVFLLDEIDVFELRLTYVLPLLVIASGLWILFGRGARRARRR